MTAPAACPAAIRLGRHLLPCGLVEPHHVHQGDLDTCDGDWNDVTATVTWVGALRVRGAA